MPVRRLRLAGVILLTALAGTGCAASNTNRTSDQSPYGQWRVAQVAGSAVTGDARITLDLAADGTVSGTGGCNRYSSKAAIDGSTIAIGPVAATKMACSAVPMEQETRFFAALERVRSWRIIEGDLLLLDGHRDILVRLAPMQAAAITIALPEGTTVDRRTVSYGCAGSSVDVDYINTGPVSLAVLTMGDAFVVMSNVVSGSGARYAGDRFVWWTRGDEASLDNLTHGEDGPGLSCRAG
jgi:heat shock protein HslJ